MKHKTFKGRLLSAFKDEIRANGMTWRKFRKLERNDTRFMTVIGKLLVEYPVSFNLEFFEDVLDISLSSREGYGPKFKQAYFKSIRKRA